MPALRKLRAVLIGLGVLAAGLPGLAEAPPEPALSSREARVFQEICATCHVQPGLGVPVLGDETEWQPRRAKGLAELLGNTVNGMGDMPPLGTCSFCSEDELRHLVAFLAGLPLDGAP